MNRDRQAGVTLPAVLLSVAGIAVLAALAAGALAPAARGRGVEGAASALRARMRSLSLAAQSDGSSRGLVFAEAGGGEPYREARDGEGDGIAREDVIRGIDATGGAEWVAREFEGVVVGWPPWSGVPDLPPSTAPLDRSGSPVRFGRARIAAFDPEGHATPGSLFLTDGVSAACAVRVSGSAARIQVYCYDPAAGRWRRAKG